MNTEGYRAHILSMDLYEWQFRLKKTVLSIGDGKNDCTYQEVFRINQGHATLFWKTSSLTEDTLVANTSIPPPLNQWTHVAYVYDGTAFTIYVDGVNDSISVVTTPYYEKRNLYLGSGYNSGDYFNGSMDEVLIFNRALSETELSALFTSGNSLSVQFRSLCNATYSYEVHTTGWEGRTATSGQRQVTVSP